MPLLVAGVLLWSAVHLFPAVAPGQRATLMAKMGEGPYKGAFSLLLVAAIVLMVVGYDPAAAMAYLPPDWGRHLNNLLMLVAVFLVGARHAKGRVKRLIRHPMLWGVVAWAAAHLLVRGDWSSVVMFGGLALWAFAAMLAANRRDGAWVRPEGGTAVGDLRHVAITLAVYAVIVLVHWQVFGLYPFPG